jgi:hypothetical protein
MLYPAELRGLADIFSNTGDERPVDRALNAGRGGSVSCMNDRLPAEGVRSGRAP